jgi:AcrR family transcriptional regulator
MTSAPVARRHSYGPNSPAIGTRGGRTRERVVSESISLFSSRGFHDTTIADIALASDISRPTLYQYFESKEEILAELLDEVGMALRRVLEQVEPLGPDAAGFRSLRNWIGEWSKIYDRYGIVVVLWTNVDLPGVNLPGDAPGVLRSCIGRIARKFDSSVLTGMDAHQAASVTNSVVHRFNVSRLRVAGTKPVSPGSIQSLAEMLQIVLFPTTLLPDLALAERAPEPRALRDFVSADAGRTHPPAHPLDADQLSSRRAATLAELEYSGARCFAENGYHRTSVEDIIAQVGVARRTFYEYFDDKLDLLLRLSYLGEDRLINLVERFVRIPAGVTGRAERRLWLADFMEFRDLYIGVIRVWVDRTPAHPVLQETRVRLSRQLRRGIRTCVCQSPLADRDTALAAETMLIGILEYLPDSNAEQMMAARHAQLVDLMEVVIDRGLYRLLPDAERPS